LKVDLELRVDQDLGEVLHEGFARDRRTVEDVADRQALGLLADPRDAPPRGRELLEVDWSRADEARLRAAGGSPSGRTVALNRAGSFDVLELVGEDRGQALLR
jgi:hypothetical protein